MKKTTAARDPAALAAAPKDLHLAGAPLHALGTTPAVGLDVPALAATARAQRLDERNAAAEAAEATRQHDKLQRYHQDMAPFRTDQPRLRANLNHRVVVVLVVRNSDALFVLMECLPARSAVWLLHVGQRKDIRAASTKMASTCWMLLSRHLITSWFKFRRLCESKLAWLS